MQAINHLNKLVMAAAGPQVDVPTDDVTESSPSNLA